jgi:transposase
MGWTVAIGVDTHKDVHVAVACDRLGAQLGSCVVAANGAGYRRLWRWACALGAPAFALEGAGSYGAGLARSLEAAGASVYECERPRQQSPALVAVLRRLGRRVQQLERELGELEQELEAAVRTLAPELVQECGVGIVSAAQLLVSSGDPTRMRSEASFAALAGTSPVAASSGRRQRHRLNRGGDRHLNEALHVISLTRVVHHQPTARYYAKLIESGKTKREARRCVKRTLARYFYRKLRSSPSQTLTT